MLRSQPFVLRTKSVFRVTNLLDRIRLVPFRRVGRCDRCAKAGCVSTLRWGRPTQATEMHHRASVERKPDRRCHRVDCAAMKFVGARESDCTTYRSTQKCVENLCRARTLTEDPASKSVTDPCNCRARTDLGMSDRRGTSAPQGGAEWKNQAFRKRMFQTGGKGMVGRGMAAIDHSIAAHSPAP